MKIISLISTLITIIYLLRFMFQSETIESQTQMQTSAITLCVIGGITIFFLRKYKKSIEPQVEEWEVHDQVLSAHESNLEVAE